MSNYDPDRLEFKPFFTEEERSDLHRYAAEFDLQELLTNPRTYEDRSIEYAYVSSLIEGSRYTHRGASMLLRMGVTEESKPLQDALMITGIHAGYEYALANARDADILTVDFLKDLHKISTEKVLPAAYQGTVRTSACLIANCSYVPLNNPTQMNEELKYMFSVARTIEDPFECACYVHCNLAYLQYFTDGNKRTSRLMQTAVLVNRGLTPVYMTATMVEEYLFSIVDYYELGDQRPYAELFLKAYHHTIDELLGRTPEQLEAQELATYRIEAARKRRAARMGEDK